MKNVDDLIRSFEYTCINYKMYGSGTTFAKEYSEAKAALKDEFTRLQDIENKAIKQSEYVQTHGLSEYEKVGLQGKIDCLEYINTGLQICVNLLNSGFKWHLEGLEVLQNMLDVHDDNDPWKGVVAALNIKLGELDRLKTELSHCEGKKQTVSDLDKSTIDWLRNERDNLKARLAELNVRFVEKEKSEDGLGRIALEYHKGMQQAKSDLSVLKGDIVGYDTLREHHKEHHLTEDTLESEIRSLKRSLESESAGYSECKKRVIELANKVADLEEDLD